MEVLRARRTRFGPAMVTATIAIAVAPAPGPAAAAATAPADGGPSWNLRRPHRHVERISDAFTGNVRHVVFGDSFAGHFAWTRVFPAILLVAPFDDITGLAAGAKVNHAYLRLMNAVEGGPDNLPFAVHGGNFYEVERWDDPSDRFGLCVGDLYEIYCDESIVVGPGGVYMTALLLNGPLGAGASGRFSNAGDELRVRLLYRCASDPAVNQLHSVRLVESGGTHEVVLDLRDGARRYRRDGEDPATGPRSAVPRQINAAYDELPLTALVHFDPGFEIREETVAASVDGDYFDLAGHVVYQVDADGAPRPGQYYGSLSDNSWAWRNFGQDEESDGGKTYSREQLERWLDVTALDVERKLVCWYYVDIETREPALLRQDMESMIDLTQAAAESVGYGDVVHCIVVAHMHSQPGLAEGVTRIHNNNTRDTAYTLADERANVCAISIFDATHGVYFDGRVAARDWLVEHGYDAFRYGSHTVDLSETPDLLDSGRAHPGSQDAAAFFASFIADAVRDGAIVGDLDHDGRVGIADLIALLSTWGACAPPPAECAADLNEDGVVGFADLVELLSRWTVE